MTVDINLENPRKRTKSIATETTTFESTSKKNWHIQTLSRRWSRGEVVAGVVH